MFKYVLNFIRFILILIAVYVLIPVVIMDNSINESLHVVFNNDNKKSSKVDSNDQQIEE